MAERKQTPSAPVDVDLDAIAEKAFWRFDALHKANYRDVAPELPGPMTERDAFKGTVRWLVNEMLGRHVRTEA